MDLWPGLPLEMQKIGTMNNVLGSFLSSIYRAFLIDSTWEPRYSPQLKP